MQKISGLRFRKDVAVSACIIVKWLVGSKEHSKDLGPWKAINQEEQFILKDNGIPDGVLVCSPLPAGRIYPFSNQCLLL